MSLPFITASGFAASGGPRQEGRGAKNSPQKLAGNLQSNPFGPRAELGAQRSSGSLRRAISGPAALPTMLLEAVKNDRPSEGVAIRVGVREAATPQPGEQGGRSPPTASRGSGVRQTCFVHMPLQSSTRPNRRKFQRLTTTKFRGIGPCRGEPPWVVHDRTSGRKSSMVPKWARAGTPCG